ncbi:MAG: hypothetical protein IJV71_05615 [Lachnospiraceae bacterium]|nr:hypothetical protein [Lachnospiraceae bacterium]
MPNNNETTTRFRVDISELKQSMQQARRQISLANSEFRATSSAMDNWQNSTEGVNAKIKQLESVLENQNSILESLEAQYEAVVAEQGEGSAAADRLRIAINNQRATVNSVERELGNYRERLTEVEEAEAEAARTGRTVEEVLEDVGEEAEDAGDGFTVLKGAVAEFVGNALTSLVSGITDAIGAFFSLAEETAEYRKEMGKLETAFTTAGFTTEQATEAYKDMYAILGDEGQSVEAVNMLAQLADTEQDLAKWTNIATGVYGTFGNSLPIESLTEAANHTAKVGEVQGALADALEWSGLSVDDFNGQLAACTSEQQRQQLITNTLNRVYNDAAKTYKEVNGSVMDANRAQSDYTDTLAAMGAKVEPVTDALQTGFHELLQEVFKLVEDVDLSVFTAKIEEGFTVLKDEVLPAVKEGFGWIIDNKNTLVAGLAAIASGFVAFKVVNFIKGIPAMLTAIKVGIIGINKAMKANVIGIIITLVTALVAAFVYLWNNCDSFRQFWLDLWTKIKEFARIAIEEISKFFTETLPAAIDIMIGFLKELPEKVRTWLSNTISKVSAWANDMKAKAKDAAKGFIDNAVEFIKQLPSKIWTWLTNAINKVSEWRNNMVNKAKEAASSFINRVIDSVKQLPSKIWTWLTNSASKVTTWGGNLATKGKEAAKKLLDSVVNKVKEIPSKLKSIGSDIVEGLWNGINDMSGWIGGKIKGFGDGVLSGIKDFFGIHSPSTVMADEVGKWLPEGMAVGIDKNAKSALSSMRELAVNAVGVARDGLSTAHATINGGQAAAGSSGTTNNFTQIINAPKQPSRLELYRQTKNLLGYTGGGL